MLNSARRNVAYPNPDRSDRPDIPLHLKNLVDALELDAVYNQGTNAARLAAAHYPSGGRFWWTTDTFHMYYDDGANWYGPIDFNVGPGTITTAMLQDHSVTQIKLAFLAVTDTEVAAANKDGAAGTPSMRTLGSGAAQAVAGNDSRLNRGARIDYAAITSTFDTVGFTTESGAGTVINGNNVAYDGSRVRIVFFAAGMWGAGSGQPHHVVVFKDSVAIGQIAQFNEGGGNYSMYDTPTAANHRYSIRAYSTSSSAQIFAGAGGAGQTAPAYLEVLGT